MGTSLDEFRNLMDCKDCPRIKAWVACIPGGYPPSEAKFNLGEESNRCMYDFRWPDGEEFDYTP